MVACLMMCAHIFSNTSWGNHACGVWAGPSLSEHDKRMHIINYLTHHLGIYTAQSRGLIVYPRTPVVASTVAETHSLSTY